MNEEEIEKKKRMLKDFSEKGQGQRVFFEEDLKLIRDILQELDQKESILDKVTDTLKEEMKKAKEQIKYYEKQYSISKERDSEFYIKSFHRQINRWQSRFETCREILNIIEGEKKQWKSL